MNVAIIDIIGIPYDGTTVYNQGLGGSESAVTFIAEELNKIGFSVTVFNTCDIDHAHPGNYDGVEYRPLSDLQHDHSFDIVISSRTVIPFVDAKDYAKLGDGRAQPFQTFDLYDKIVSKAKMRILWMHDTFCLGDNLIEELAISDRITDIFTLSDWHMTYVTNCHHGRRRNFEVLKNKMFVTRNGAKIYNDQVDIKAKDRDLFVYNASVTKGMIPLVKHIWPTVKKLIPTAKLKVIGGYYRFSQNSQPDQQERDWRDMANDPELAALGIEFTGVIPQKDIADILAKSNFMIYPAAFPETFGISTLESLCYNTPLLTCRFGALEEVAVEQACYLIDYAIEPNSLFTDINRDQQVKKFVGMVIAAYNNTYLHQQKQYYCNIVKDFAGWDTVALQWKQHFYSAIGQYLPVDEYRAVTKINKKLHRVFGRRYHNQVELDFYKPGVVQEIVVVSAFYNSERYLEKCIQSVAQQDYENYRHILIDDCSTDGSLDRASAVIDSLPERLRSKFEIIHNIERRGAVFNQITHIRQQNDSSIIMLLDGDDWLVNDNNIFSYYNSVYADGAEFTYGSCWSVVDNIPLISQPYPEEVKQARAYRQHRFNWGLPYTHFRTFRKNLVNDLDDRCFQDKDSQWYRAGGDGAVFYSILEKADPDKVVCLQEIVYQYNDTNPLNDYKVNGEEQNRNAREIVNLQSMINKIPDLKSTQRPSALQHIEQIAATSQQPKKKILIAIPTAKYIEPETFKSIYDLIVPEGYETTFQYFYGYNIDQIRNLIADWTVKGYDYLFSVDSDIAFASDTLVRLLKHDQPVVSGLYIQRKPGQHTLEVYEDNGKGGVTNIPYSKIKGRGLVEIAGCGFGCVLVKTEVIKAIGYPQFKYHSAIDHKNTISEDVYFCRRAKELGFKMFADTGIKCRHIGHAEFLVNDDVQEQPPAAGVRPEDITERLRTLGSQRLIPRAHVDFLSGLKDRGVEPKVIYDIGACVLHWTNEARNIWPDADFVVFEAMPECEFLYKEQSLDYHIGVISDQSGKTVDFYQNTYHPGGNSYYRENAEVNPEATEYFNDQHRRSYTTVTLDAVQRLKKLPAPDLVKMDVQGAELDVLKGARECMVNCDHVILELQKVEYNRGAPLKDTVIEWMESQGFECQGAFSDQGPDGDYYFVRRSRPLQTSNQSIASLILDI